MNLLYFVWFEHSLFDLQDKASLWFKNHAPTSRQHSTCVTVSDCSWFSSSCPPWHYTSSRNSEIIFDLGKDSTWYPDTDMGIVRFDRYVHGSVITSEDNIEREFCGSCSWLGRSVSKWEQRLYSNYLMLIVGNGLSLALIIDQARACSGWNDYYLDRTQIPWIETELVMSECEKSYAAW